MWKYIVAAVFFIYVMRETAALHVKLAVDTAFKYRTRAYNIFLCMYQKQNTQYLYANSQ